VSPEALEPKNIERPGPPAIAPLTVRDFLSPSKNTLSKSAHRHVQKAISSMFSGS
jgi:hypothetical protein